MQESKSYKNAAWELYVELVTRISVERLDYGDGLMREALSSLHKLFLLSRDVLKSYGPGLAKVNTPHGKPLSEMVLEMLNDEIRPFLSKWHPALKNYEDNRTNDTSQTLHEFQWDFYTELRGELETLQKKLIVYAERFKQLALE